MRCSAKRLSNSAAREPVAVRLSHAIVAPASLPQVPPQRETPASKTSAETTADAIAALDVQFPWLKEAEKRRPE